MQKKIYSLKISLLNYLNQEVNSHDTMASYYKINDIKQINLKPIKIYFSFIDFIMQLSHKI